MKTILALSLTICLLLTGCHTNSSGWTVIPFMNNGHSQRAELKPEIVDKYLTPLSDPAFQKPNTGNPKPETRRTLVAVAPPTRWPRMAVLWSDRCDMNHPWIPTCTIYSGSNVADLKFRTNVLNPFPMIWGMSNGVAWSAFVPVTNGVNFDGQPQEYFQRK